MFIRLAVAMSLLIAGGLAASAGSPAQAGIVFVADGCGLAFHRTFDGACVLNRRIYGAPVIVERLPPPCPRGYHRDRDPARPICYPNF